jgi:hypothetical protein
MMTYERFAEIGAAMQNRTETDEMRREIFKVAKLAFVFLEALETQEMVETDPDKYIRNGYAEVAVVMRRMALNAAKGA